MKLNKAAVSAFADELNIHLLERIIANAAACKSALNWKSLPLKQRADAIRLLVDIALDFRDEKSQETECTDSYHSENRSIAAYYMSGAKKFKFFRHVLTTDDFGKVIGIIVHEITHLLQEAGKSTLTIEQAEFAKNNYVQPGQNIAAYRGNLLEQEAHAVQGIIEKNFMPELKRVSAALQEFGRISAGRDKARRQNNYQNAA
jgi:hypothetical protein